MGGNRVSAFIIFRSVPASFTSSAGQTTDIEHAASVVLTVTGSRLKSRIGATVAIATASVATTVATTGL